MLNPSHAALSDHGCTSVRACVQQPAAQAARRAAGAATPGCSCCAIGQSSVGHHVEMIRPLCVSTDAHQLLEMYHASFHHTLRHLIAVCSFRSKRKRPSMPEIARKRRQRSKQQSAARSERFPVADSLPSLQIAACLHGFSLARGRAQQACSNPAVHWPLLSDIVQSCAHCSSICKCKLPNIFDAAPCRSHILWAASERACILNSVSLIWPGLVQDKSFQLLTGAEALRSESPESEDEEAGEAAAKSGQAAASKVRQPLCLSS